MSSLEMDQMDTRRNATHKLARSCFGTGPELHALNRQQEEELASDLSDEADDDDDDDDDGFEGATSKDKENLSPNDASGGTAEGKKGGTGRKRKRQTGGKARRQVQGTEATRRQRIRQYYNGATHGSASAVQLFAMAMQVRSP